MNTSGMRTLAWRGCWQIALTKQQDNGWFADNCLSDPKRPLTHTIGYVLRGVVEAHRLSGEGDLLQAACRTADGILPAVEPDGRLAGQFDSRWRAAANYVCLTGSVQIAHCLLLLGRATGNVEYHRKGLALNAYVRRSIRMDGPPEVHGGVKGSFPVDGDYGTNQYLNWAAKFMIDANLLELDLA